MRMTNSTVDACLGTPGRTAQVTRIALLASACAVALLMFSSVAAVAAEPEAPVAKPATAVTGNSAVLHGELNPNAPGEPGEYYFKLKQSTEACFPEATEFPEPYGDSLGAAKEAVETEAANLEPNETYSYCLVAEPSSLRSAPLTFKTLPTAKPFVYKGSTSATEIAAFSATLSAAVNPEDQETTYAFEFATNEAFTGAQTVSGAGPLPAQEFFTQEIPASLSTGDLLAPETTYFFRVLATDATGTTQGPVEQFTTRPAADPTVISESVSAQNSFEPKLEARINPTFESTSYYFEYSASAAAVLEGKGTVVNGAPPAADLPAVFEEEPGVLAGPVGITGLQAGTTYYYRVVASDKTSEVEGHPVEGPLQEFHADGDPVLATGAAQEPTRTAAVVSGTITPQGLPTTYRFVYVAAPDYRPGAEECPGGVACAYAAGRSTYDTKLEGAPYLPNPVVLTLEELAPGTTYDYALLASNELGTVVGANATFTTAAATAPIAVTGGAEAVSQLSAIINGTVDTRGLQSTAQFEFGPAPYAGALLPAAVTVSSGTVDSINLSFSGDLLPGTTYYYRTVASNQDGTSYGALRSFTSSPLVTSSGAAPVALIAWPPFVTAELAASPPHLTPAAPAPRPSTNAQKLAKALKACGRKPKRQRAGCRRSAKRRYR